MIAQPQGSDIVQKIFRYSWKFGKYILNCEKTSIEIVTFLACNVYYVHLLTDA